MSRTDYILVETTHVPWPGCLPWRGPNSRVGYPTEKAAEERARVIRDHYAAKHGRGGPVLTVRERAR